MVPLNSVLQGKIVKIVKIEAGRGLYQKLNSMGILPGDIIKVVNTTGGPIVVSKGGMRLALGRAMSCKILVEEIN
ncbi:MAG: FeoA family protein [bacterium]|nr:FeoA family protein [bacterium]